MIVHPETKPQTFCWSCDPDRWEKAHGDHTICIDGTVYGPCESEFCNGGCESQGDCRCECHKQQEEAS